jgi:hypothetical protein
MLMTCIKKFGLYDRLNEIRCGVVNDLGILIDDDVFNNEKIKIIYIGKSEEYERPTLLHMRMQSEIDHEKTRYCYLHTKGLRHFGKPQELNVIDWINLMLYWNVELWKYAIRKLARYDTYGCDYTKSIKNTGEHYSGNFWWARASHIKKLSVNIAANYTAPETWILTEKGKIYNAHNSGLAGMGHYHHRYPRSRYETKLLS